MSGRNSFLNSIDLPLHHSYTPQVTQHNTAKKASHVENHPARQCLSLEICLHRFWTAPINKSQCFEDARPCQVLHTPNLDYRRNGVYVNIHIYIYKYNYLYYMYVYKYIIYIYVYLLRFCYLLEAHGLHKEWPSQEAITTWSFIILGSRTTPSLSKFDPRNSTGNPNVKMVMLVNQS